MKQNKLNAGWKVTPLSEEPDVTLEQLREFYYSDPNLFRPLIDKELTEYTPLRRFYAWIGFLAIAIGMIWGLWTMFTRGQVIVVTNDNTTHQEAIYASPENQKTSYYLGPKAYYKTIAAEVTAYTSDPAETDDTPDITASNKKVQPGIAANNCLPFGTRIWIDHNPYTVEDRMNRRYDCQHFDVWMESKVDALEFGRQEKLITIRYYE